MLMPLLLLATALCPIQDAQRPAPATETQDARAAADPAAAPAAPAATADNVRNFLMEAEGHLYDPKAAGLKSLSFDMAIDVPELGNLGTVHVRWTDSAPPEIKVDRAEGVQLPPGIPPEQIDQSGMGAGQQLLLTMLNHPISPLLDAFTATMEGAQDGLVKVNFTAPDMVERGLKEQAFYFDDDSHLQKATVVAEQMGMTVKQTQSFTWKDSVSDNHLVLDTQTSETVTPMGTISSRTAFSYRMVDDLLVLTQMSVTNEAPPMLGGKSTQAMAATSLVVNGKAVPDEVVAPIAPDAPAPGSGG